MCIRCVRHTPQAARFPFQTFHLIILIVHFEQLPNVALLYGIILIHNTSENINTFWFRCNILYVWLLLFFFFTTRIENPPHKLLQHFLTCCVAHGSCSNRSQLNPWSQLLHVSQMPIKADGWVHTDHCGSVCGGPWRYCITTPKYLPLGLTADICSMCVCVYVCCNQPFWIHSNHDAFWIATKWQTASRFVCWFLLPSSSSGSSVLQSDTFLSQLQFYVL